MIFIRGSRWGPRSARADEGVAELADPAPDPLLDAAIGRPPVATGHPPAVSELAALALPPVENDLHVLLLTELAGQVGVEVRLMAGDDEEVAGHRGFLARKIDATEKGQR